MNTSLFLAHKFELSDIENSLFSEYLQIFMEYNKHTNLSAIRDEQGIIEKHFVDSLYGTTIISSFLSHENSSTYRLLDIGSGGGFPGIPLKIVFPEIEVTLLDSVGKKVKAMNFFIERLRLQNIYAIQERAEILGKNPEYAKKFDFVVSRATAYITDILVWSTPFLKSTGKIILYKAPSSDERKDMVRMAKKLGLTLVGDLEYSIEGKERVLFVFSKSERIS